MALTKQDLHAIREIVDTQIHAAIRNQNAFIEQQLHKQNEYFTQQINLLLLKAQQTSRSLVISHDEKEHMRQDISSLDERVAAIEHYLDLNDGEV